MEMISDCISIKLLRPDITHLVVHKLSCTDRIRTLSGASLTRMEMAN